MTGLNYSEGRPIPLPISQGGTGSPTQNFVDLSSTQTVGGNKIYTGNTVYNVASGTIADYQVGGSSKLAITSATVTVVPQMNTRNVAPSSNGNYTIGSTGLYYLNGYVTTWNANSTASISGSTAGVLDITGAINTSGLTTMTQSGGSTTGALVIQDNTSSAANAVVTIEDDTNYAFSGTLLTLTQFNSSDTGTPLQINNYGTSSASLNITNGTSTVFSISQAGLPTFGGTNTTGSGTALLGANSPASTNTAPYTWIEAIAADGSTVYIPAWK